MSQLPAYDSSEISSCRLFRWLPWVLDVSWFASSAGASSSGTSTFGTSSDGTSSSNLGEGVTLPLATSSSVVDAVVSAIRRALWAWIVRNLRAQTFTSPLIYFAMFAMHEFVERPKCSCSAVTIIAANAVSDALWATKKKSHEDNSIMNWHVSITDDTTCWDPFSPFRNISEKVWYR